MKKLAVYTTNLLALEGKPSQNGYELIGLQDKIASGEISPSASGYVGHIVVEGAALVARVVARDAEARKAGEAPIVNDSLRNYFAEKVYNVMIGLKEVDSGNGGN